jgi:hypothetical protein
VQEHATKGDPDESGISLIAAAGNIETDDTALAAAVAGAVSPVNRCRPGSVTRLENGMLRAREGSRISRPKASGKRGSRPLSAAREQGR